jgi:hypothetical protein
LQLATGFQLEGNQKKKKKKETKDKRQKDSVMWPITPCECIITYYLTWNPWNIPKGVFWLEKFLTPPFYFYFFDGDFAQ